MRARLFAVPRGHALVRAVPRGLVPAGAGTDAVRPVSSGDGQQPSRPIEPVREVARVLLIFSIMMVFVLEVLNPSLSDS